MRRETLKKLKHFTTKGHIFLKTKSIDYLFIPAVGTLSHSAAVIEYVFTTLAFLKQVN